MKTVYIIAIISIVLGWFFMSLGYDRAYGGDDKRWVLRMIQFTTDRSYIDLLFSWIKDCIYKIFHPAEMPRYFCLTTMNYAVWKIAARNVFAYRSILLVYTFVAVLLLAFFIYQYTSNLKVSFAIIAMMPLMVNLFAGIETNPLYSYQAIAQRTFIYWILAMIMLMLYRKHDKAIFLAVSAILMFCSCMVIEVGYLLIVPAFFLIMGLEEPVKNRIKMILPLGTAVLVAGIGYIICLSQQGMTGDTSVNIDLSQILITSAKQFFTSFSIFPMLLSEYDFHLLYIHIDDILLSLGLAVIILGFTIRAEKLDESKSGYISIAGWSMMIFPAFLMGIVGKFQNSGLITWERGWIIDIIQCLGGVIVVTIWLYRIVQWIKNNIKMHAVQTICFLCIGIVVSLIGIYSRASAREHSENNRIEYEMLQDSLSNGAMEDVKDGDHIVCDYSVYGTNEEAESLFFHIYAGKSVDARVGTIDDADPGDWVVTYGFDQENSIACLYVAKITDDRQKTSNEHVWVESVDEGNIRNWISTTGQVFTISGIDKVIELKNGRFGLLIE